MHAAGNLNSYTATDMPISAAAINDHPVIRRNLACSIRRPLMLSLTRYARALVLTGCFAWAASAEPPARQTPAGQLGVAVYEGAGAAGKGVPRVLALLGSATNVSVTRVSPKDIQAGVLKRFQVVVFTGGSGSGQARALEHAGCKEVKEFVQQGGGYVGICAGSYLACSGFSWGLGLINAKTLSPLWKRGTATVKIELTDRGREILGPLQGELDCLYYQGPIVGPAGVAGLPEYEPLAFFRSEVAKNNTPKGIMVNSPAIFASRFGKGRVLCFSPHPEQTKGLESFVTRVVAWAAASPRDAETEPKATAPASSPAGLWKVGVARANITPTNALWMAGYAGRTRPAEGKATDLWLKALAFEDAAGHRAVILSADLIAIRGRLYRRCLPRLKDKLGLEPAQILLTASHTHCGPMVPNRPGSLSAFDEKDRLLIEQYEADLEDKIIETASRAFADLAPARLVAGQAKADFAANRRNNAEADRPRLAEQGNLAGPVDHSVPVLAAYRPDGKLRAVLFGYACHNTTLPRRFLQVVRRLCGLRPGFAGAEPSRGHRRVLRRLRRRPGPGRSRHARFGAALWQHACRRRRGILERAVRHARPDAQDPDGDRQPQPRRGANRSGTGEVRARPSRLMCAAGRPTCWPR